jgi:transcriptional regulator with XRE-family HTH domain
VAIGDKIRNIRMKRDMTQKELGLAIGFNERTADVRMAQYESGTRVPKVAIIVKIAEALSVNPDYLMAPAIDKTEEIIHALIYLDELNQLKMEV